MANLSYLTPPFKKNAVFKNKQQMRLPQQPHD